MVGKRLNKKGSLVDVVFIGISLIVVAIVVLIVFKVSDSINTELQTNGVLSDLEGGAEGKAAFSQVNDHFTGALDNSFLFLTIGLAIVTIGLAIMVRIHPIFFIFFLIGLIFLIFICGVLSNIYQTMAENPELAVQANKLVFITTIITFLPFIVGTIGIVVSIVLYMNWQNA